MMTAQTIMRAAAFALAVTAIVPAYAAADCGGALTSLMPAARPADPNSALARSGGIVQTAASSQDPAAIVGLWSVTLTSGGSVIDIGYDAWHADGTEILNDASPVSHNVCLGVWIQSGPRTFQLKHPALRFDAVGNVIGTLVLREVNVVNRRGDHFAGTFTIEFFDLAGNSIFTGAGEISGERITVD